MTSARLTLAALALALAAAAPSPARAQSSKADVFAGKIPPVSGQLFQKAGRFELTVVGDVSLNDAFFTKYLAGLEASYHLSETWAVSVGAAGDLVDMGAIHLGAVSPSGSSVTCTATGGCVGADQEMLRQVPGRIRGVASATVAWAPVYGKLNVLAEKVGHFDLAVLAGGDLVRRDEILAANDPRVTLKASRVWTPGFHAGLGARLFVTQGIALRLIVKDVFYPVKVPNAGTGNDWQNQLFTELGLSFFFPTQNRP